MDVSSKTIEATGDDGAFEVDLYSGVSAIRTVLFAVGRGGRPERHAGLLTKLAMHGCTVIAPHFGPIPSSVPTAADLRSRVRRLILARHRFAESGIPVIGLGHSLGAASLLMLAGAEAHTLNGDKVPSTPGFDFAALLLLAPAVDFFLAPDALSRVQVPIWVWAGEEDRVVAPEKVAQLASTLQGKVILDKHAGHFSFMDEPPPGMIDPHPDRAAFLDRLTTEVCRIAMACGLDDKPRAD